jgi:hypothetical protein
MKPESKNETTCCASRARSPSSGQFHYYMESKGTSVPYGEADFHSRVDRSLGK